MLVGDPASNVAAVALIRAAITDDKESGVLILSQNGLLHDRQTSALGMSLGGRGGAGSHDGVRVQRRAGAPDS